MDGNAEIDEHFSFGMFFVVGMVDFKRKGFSY